MKRAAVVDAAAALVAGLGLGIVALSGGTLVLYTGEGLLAAAAFLLALGIAATAAGVWVGLRDGARTHSRVRWTGAVVAFAAAAIFVELWLLARGFRTTALGGLLAAVFLVAEPAYVVGALLATLQARAGRHTRMGVSREHRRGRVARPSMPPAVFGALGAAAGIMAGALVVVPGIRLGTAFLLVAIGVAVAGQVEARLGRHAEREEDGMRGKVVVITGVGGRGQLGFALAEAFLRRGARVLVAGRRPHVEEHARELAAGGGEVVSTVADLTTGDGAAGVVRAAVERFGGIDVLVNAAGGLTLIKPVGDTELEEWNAEIARNATTAFAMTRAALPVLRERGGSVVNFTSPAAGRAPASLGAYAAAKAAVSALTRAVAMEERGRVRVNAIAPGLIDTEQNRASAREPANVAWVTREQVADVVLFLTDEQSEGINGQVIEVPGRGLS